MADCHSTDFVPASRAEAKASNTTRYFTGLPCKSGHVAARLTVNGSCCECSRLKAVAYHHSNRERVLDRLREYGKSAAGREGKQRRRLERDPELPVRKEAAAKELQRRSEARNAGLTVYRSGRQCKQRHEPLRFVRDGKCVECNRLGCAKRAASRLEQNPTLKLARESKRAKAEARKAASVEAQRVHRARQDAIACGANTYLGRSCVHGHVGIRYAKSGMCIACAQEKSKSAEKKRYDREYLQKNRERVLARVREYQSLHRERLVRKAAQWAATNPDRIKAIKAAYKARRRQLEAGGDPTSVILKWERRTAKVCYWCDARCDKSYHVDHYEPLSKGGKHEIRNLVIACPSCNLRKSARDPFDFAKLCGRLF